MRYMKSVGLIVIALLALSGCGNKEEAANKLFVEMTQNAQKASVEQASHAKKYEYYQMAKVSYKEIVEKYPETSIALKLSTGDAQILDKNPLMFLQMDRQLYELSEIEKAPFNLLSERILKGTVDKNNIRLLGLMMKAYAEAGRGNDAQHLYKAMNAFYDASKDQSERDEFKIGGALVYATAIKTSDSLSELDKAYKIALKKYGAPKPGADEDYFKFAKAYVTQQKTDVAEKILKDLGNPDYHDDQGNIDFDYIVKAAEIYALFKKDYSIQLAELGLSELLKSKSDRSIYLPGLLKNVYREGQEEKFKEHFKEAFAWFKQLPEPGPRDFGSIYQIADLAQLLKELKIKDAYLLIPSYSIQGTYKESSAYDLGNLGKYYGALGQNAYAIEAYDKAVEIAKADQSHSSLKLHTIFEHLLRDNNINKSREIAALITDEDLKQSALIWIVKAHAKNQNYVFAMKTFNEMNAGYVRTWIDIVAEQMLSGKVPTYEFIEEAYRGYSTLKKP